MDRIWKAHRRPLEGAEARCIKPVWDVQQATTLGAGSGPQHNAGLRHEQKEKHNQHVLNNQRIGSIHTVLLACHWRSLSFFPRGLRAAPLSALSDTTGPPECHGIIHLHLARERQDCRLGTLASSTLLHHVPALATRQEHLREFVKERALVDDEPAVRQAKTRPMAAPITISTFSCPSARVPP
ncbi:hypothetical protein L13192_00986 [Pyrenophora tritici-repentis]|uniref:Uncharacterized protein n=1 Tax=Pyrenophora tritici-repentis TaxID=45151 RepID=A0A922NG83_9PLEO|nr:hypothetical protein Ptr86124_007541 [Pyrenophora tritici-repentis]KAI1674239.1 hypothetical protein L13192_00986 [Pyrenophora tritici-repentis]KAI1688651.1 hypothetical protein KJE20_01829 [Pyrenophora tritici-repentis]